MTAEEIRALASECAESIDTMGTGRTQAFVAGFIAGLEAAADEDAKCGGWARHEIDNLIAAAKEAAK